MGKHKEFPKVSDLHRMSEQLQDVGYGYGAHDITGEVRPFMPGWRTTLHHEGHAITLSCHDPADRRTSYHFKIAEPFDDGEYARVYSGSIYETERVRFPDAAHQTVARIGFAVGDLLMEQAMAENGTPLQPTVPLSAELDLAA